MERSRMLLIVAAALFLGSFTLLMLDSQIATDNTKLVTERDSLKSECSVKDIDLGRYEYVYHQLDTVCKTQIDSILQNVE
jgi:hypothetical protein